VADVPPQNIVSISFPLGGYLKSTKLLPGMQVKKGEVVGYIEDQQIVKFQEEYLVGKERLQYLELEFNRQKELNDNQVNATKIFQQTQADLNSQRVLVKSMSEKLRLIGIEPSSLHADNLSRIVPLRSPISGYVSKILVNIGKYIQPSEVLFELIDPGDLHAALTVFQKDIAKVEIGQSVTLSLVNNPEKEYRGRVILTNRNLDDTRSAMIHCHFEDRPEKILPGMFLSGKIRSTPREVSALPETSVVNFEGKQYVFVEVGANTFFMTAVQTGARENGYLEIVNAAEIKGQVVTKNAFTILGALKNVAEEE
ncbi:MAG: efflux RND transporter periplasmic adaptor subunit, partial [Sphingobacteriales bacterium]